ncbi:MAG: lactoferrin/transferrin family TonB-dependent receptor, partial [Neisseria sp.]|nr:lactoferrin/transferrin family TonB-dependent receptor [Neisseria sp.]
MQNHFQPNKMVLALLSALVVQTAYADEVAQAVELKQIEVKAKKRVGRKDNEVTGLGKVVKSKEKISEEQILGIRDLTRYDPGIAVVEQGRGASSGYSIRGVDRNRVALVVDGLPQAQSYLTQNSDANGGAINEIEYENLRSIEISKGASSAEYGNGALGGAVGFATKDSSDVIKSGQNWGLDSKTAYSSKNNQFTQSLAAAGRAGGFDALLQHTYRRGSEIEAHDAIHDVQQSFTRWAGAETTDANPNARHTWFVVQDDCADGSNCAPKAKATLVKKNETVSASEYTGPDRIAPNPMDYDSRSWLFKGGFRFDPQHYVGTVFEHTQQNYDIQNMLRPSYYAVASNTRTRDDQDTNLKSFSDSGIYRNNPNEAFGLPSSVGNDRSLALAEAHFFDEHHRKQRLGAFYEYSNPAKNGWADKAQISFDKQDIKLNSHSRLLRCSTYPTIDPNCQVTPNLAWSWKETDRNIYQETHNLLKFNWEKELQLSNSKHRLFGSIGYDKFKSILQRTEYKRQYLDDANNYPFVEIGSADGTFANPRIYKMVSPTVVNGDYCDYTGNKKDVTDCTPRKITGSNIFLALRDNISFGKYVDWGLGVRYDRHTFKTNDDWISSGTYKNWSWNSGLTVKPTDFLALSYRISSGYRVPAFYELFGRRVRGTTNDSVSKNAHHVGKFEAEKALNQEFGVGFKGNFGFLEVSHFYNKYKDMIAEGKVAGGDENIGYHNLQNLTLTGFNVLGKIDWNGVASFLPEGLYSNIAFSKIKAKKRSIREGYTFASDPLLDTLQPSRIVLGLGYDHPDGKWGINSTMTYSKAKNQDELLGARYFSNGNDAQAATALSSKRWYIYDLTGYVNLKKFLTLRAGIYN